MLCFHLTAWKNVCAGWKKKVSEFYNNEGALSEVPHRSTHARLRPIVFLIKPDGRNRVRRPKAALADSACIGRPYPKSINDLST